MVQTAVLQAEPTAFMALATEYPPQVLLCTFPAPSSYPAAPYLLRVCVSFASRIVTLQPWPWEVCGS